MVSLQNSYRTTATNIRLSLTKKAIALSGLCLSCMLLHAQTNPPAKLAPKTSQAAPAPIKQEPQGSTKQDTAPQGSAIDTRQEAFRTVMEASLAKQRSAIQSQIASTVTTNEFFASPWTTAPVFPTPTVISGCSAMPEDELKPLVEDAAKAQSLKPELIRSVIRAESAAYPCAVSEKGALGLMQLMPDVADQFHVDPLDPKQNIAGGSQYLKQLMDRYKGDMKLALSAYNAGPQRVDSSGGKVPDIPETIAYVDTILKDLSQNATAVKK